jgi:ABC-type Fe3+/spermidine/putrescine transport system ATPase subunit
MPGLIVDSISKSYGAVRALKDITFQLDPGEIVALLGPSGCGKSTLLSIIAGLEKPDQGDILWDGVSISPLPPHQRGFGLMFQDFALFPHLNVRANIAFGLRIKQMSSEAINQRVREVLELVGLPEYASRDIHTLSGGEQQRVALARSLAPGPRLLMLDEPLGSLDRNLRERLSGDLRRILHQANQTAIYVTHDQEEAFTLADRVIVMNQGAIEQVGPPQEIYCSPATPFVAHFLELANLLDGEAIKDGRGLIVHTSLGAFPVDQNNPTGAVTVLIRPDQANLDDAGPLVLKGFIQEISFRGNRHRVIIAINQIPLIFYFAVDELLPFPGQEVAISLDPAKSIRLYRKTPVTG